ncbi:ectonucleotide pyrophosphatase/phosphodiesterase family member 7-like [Marmota monax]|uniref:ectonucleotide pyrophosphatase/phosphodiesterase family member 7-like n=1 Tax=Marmota monax TaxID=9995 RepID=UPI001EAFA149|nr:ectonucleotide pyrophosphatase/phosphodiesterase family member 7-like [Marmota monax]
MRASATLLAGALATLLAPGAGVPIRRQDRQNKLLLVSFDGFRWNYDLDVETPNLDAMARDGVKARYMTPAFVTQTSPCHFTLVTGKYIENHGVVHNMFYNFTTKVKLPYHATLGIQSWWDSGSVPIWITAQRQGLKTGSFFYPGGNVTYQGTAVTLSRKEGILHNYKDEKEWRANIDTVMRWFTEEDLALVTLYFGEPDSTGHRYGPESPERKEMVRQVDRTVGYLRDSIERNSLTSSLDLIVTSDHGMTTVNKTASDLVEFHKFPNFTFQDIEFELLDYGPNGMLIPKEGRLEKVYGVLKDAHPRLHVYKKEQFPKSFHYADHPRIAPLVMYSDPGYVIHGRINVQFNNGEHGFDNKDLDMKTIFRAVGPSFKEGLEVAPFESVHVYELMCQLLGIVPEPNDGDPDTLKPMLRSSGGGPPSPAPSTGGPPSPTPSTGGPPSPAPSTGGPPSPAPSTDPGWHGHTELPSGSALLPKGRPPLMSALLGTLTLLAKVTFSPDGPEAGSMRSLTRCWEQHPEPASGATSAAAWLRAGFLLRGSSACSPAEPALALSPGGGARALLNACASFLQPLRTYREELGSVFSSAPPASAAPAELLDQPGEGVEDR